MITRTSLVLALAAGCAGEIDAGGGGGGGGPDVDGDGQPDGVDFGATAGAAGRFGAAGPDGPPDVSSLCAPQEGGTDYEVGPGKTYASISEVPWEEVGAGATVRIHWRPEPYAEKIAIGGQGTEEAPIRVCGIPGPDGQLPTITGVNATTRPGMDFSHATIEDLGIVVIARYGFDESPAHVIVEGLHVTGAYDAYTYKSSTGATRTYSPAAACIRVQEGDHITLRGNMITDCGNGFMVISKADHRQKLTTDLLVEANYVQDNGIAGSDRQHNSYIQAVGATYQYNYFGRPREGSRGVNVKDRSTGLVLRYNWVEGGPGRVLDIVDAEDYGPYVMEDAYMQSLYGASPDPSMLEFVRANEKLYRTTYVYGNFFRSVGSTDAGLIVHYGHDTVPRYTRKGTLWFYNNTVVLLIDQKSTWKVRLFDLSTAEETAEVFNNVVHLESETPGAVPGGLHLTRYAGKVKLGKNWITPDWLSGDGSVTGSENLIGGVEPPVDLETLLPAAGSPVLDQAVPVDAALPQVDSQYVPPTEGSERPVVGAGMDLGAAELQ